MRSLLDRVLATIRSARSLFGTQNHAKDGLAIPSKNFGRESERSAATYLQERGYNILHRNYRIARVEIYLVADHQGTLVFIEVKARRSVRFGSPVQSVDFRKQERLTHVAKHYLHRFHCGDLNCRFDVVVLIQESSGKAKIDLIQNAFDL